jgi:hypothetical protein
MAYIPRKRPGLSYKDRLVADMGHRDWKGALPVALSKDYFYVPGEMLLSEAALDLFRGELERRGGKPDNDTNERFQALGMDVRRWLLPEQNVPRLVAEFRVLADDKAAVTISPNSVLRAQPAYWGGPGGEPHLADDPQASPSEPRSETPDVAVLDTGIWRGYEGQPLIANCVSPDATDVDVLDVDGNVGLDSMAGHGTFISGVIAQAAAGLRIDPGKVLDPTGVGDDVSIALELFETEAPVINLSLGGYTDNNRPPPALEQALSRFWPDRIVVAAAGNNGSDRPFWPAALKHVIAVGALDTRDPKRGLRRAPFSNFGPWVDVWAPGVGLVSTYVDGQWVTSDQNVNFQGWASWMGTSFAAPLVSAEIARRAAGGSARKAAMELLAELPAEPGLGLVYTPSAKPGDQMTNATPPTPTG